jgi:hypothetical protein
MTIQIRSCLGEKTYINGLRVSSNECDITIEFWNYV